MDESKFKNFVLDFVNENYSLNERGVPARLRTFCCRVIVPLFLANFEAFKYYLKRKKVVISEDSSQIWLRDKLNEQMDP